jgi:hypothetical protein
MNPNELIGVHPDLLLTRTKGALLLFGTELDEVIAVPPKAKGIALIIVTYRTGSVHFCHRNMKEQSTALVSTVAFQ